MSLVINNNIPAFSTNNILSAKTNALTKAIEKVSTGLRINRASDDASGMAISERLRLQVAGLDKAIVNAEDGISMLQTATGGLSDTYDILQHMRELSVQAANDTLTSQDRAHAQAEIEQLRDEITFIGNSTQFNAKKLLNGDASLLWSSDKLSTQAIVRGTVRSIDQFGQKGATQGNYNISITATPGKAQVQKSNIMKIKHQVIDDASDNGTGTLTLKNFDKKLKDSFESSSNEFTLTVTDAAGATTISLSGSDVKGDADWAAKINAALTAAGSASRVDTAELNAAGTDFEIKFTAGTTTPSAATASVDTIGLTATSDTKLRDIDTFWSSEGAYMLDIPQTITVTQGNAKQANFTLYGNDTVSDLVGKFNNAIANDLGQGQYVNDTAHFANFVDTDTPATSEGTPGTIVIRSVQSGRAGELIVSTGAEELLSSLGISQLQEATETQYTVNVVDAHSGQEIASNVKFSGNRMIGLIHPNIDVLFDAMTGITANWNDATKAFDYNTPTTVDTYLHVAANTAVFQSGANEGEDLGVNIGDMRATALGLDSVILTDRESAAKSITIIDNALDKVSAQMSELGKCGDRLSHTVNNLMVSCVNMSSAESVIRDVDMASEMTTIAKLQIALQSGTAMLAQANQLPQNVLSLIR